MLLGAGNTIVSSGCDVWRHRELLRKLVIRDLFGYRLGQAFALAWVLVQPAILVVVYLTVFTTIFRTRVVIDGVERADFHYYLIAGLLPWLFTADVIVRSTSQLRDRANYVRHLAVPLVVIAVSPLIASFLIFALQMLLLVLVIIVDRGPSLALLALPVAIAIHFVSLFGVTLVLTAFGALSRTVGEFARIYATVGMFLAPIFFMTDSVPAVYRIVMFVNPMTYYVEIFHDVVYFESMRHPVAWLIALVLAVLVTGAGAVAFGRAAPRVSESL